MMADRTSAALFGSFFEYLAENPDQRAKTMAIQLWRDTWSYDFNQYQMECDDALIKLGLAKKRRDKSIVYRASDAKTWEVER